MWKRRTRWGWAHVALHSARTGSFYALEAQPQQNGKVERSHRIDTEEFWRREAPPDFLAALPALQARERRYNFARFSVALKGETPAEKLQRLLPDVNVA